MPSLASLNHCRELCRLSTLLNRSSFSIIINVDNCRSSLEPNPIRQLLKSFIMEGASNTITPADSDTQMFARLAGWSHDAVLAMTMAPQQAPKGAIAPRMSRVDSKAG